MIIDINATIGHYPFRQLAATTADQMVALMNEWSIDRAIVSSMHAAFYRDAQRGNAELFGQTRAHPDRFGCVATVNPKYAGWQRDLEEAVVTWKMRAVTLLPAYHGYDLSDPGADEAVRAILDHDVPLVLMPSFEDRRQRHHWDVADDLPLAAVMALAERHPRLRLALVNWVGLDAGKLKAAGLAGRVLIDFARLHVLLLEDVPKLIDALGIESIAFGSHMPFDYTAAALVKLANLDGLSDGDRNRVEWRNAANFFRLEAP